MFGYSADEYATVAEKAVEAGADAVELNVSCPHVQVYWLGNRSKPSSLLSQVVEKVKATINKPVIVKLSPNVADIARISSGSS